MRQFLKQLDISCIDSRIQLYISFFLRLVLFCFVCLYGISTIVGYLMSNRFLYISAVLFHTNQFNIRIEFSWGATTPGQSGIGNDGKKGLLRIPQSFSNSDCLVSYPGHTMREFYRAPGMQSAYSATPIDWAIAYRVEGNYLRRSLLIF